MRGFEENSLGPQSTAGARYLTQSNISLLKDDQGNIARNEDGSAVGFSNEYGYQTTNVIDENGNVVLDKNGLPEVKLAVENFYLDKDYDSFGGNILTTATFELLFPLSLVSREFRKDPGGPETCVTGERFAELRKSLRSSKSWVPFGPRRITV